MAPGKPPRIFYGYIIVAACFLILLMAWGAMYSYGVFFKPLSTEFGWTRAVTSGAYSLNMILAGFLGIVTGRLNDRLGPRKVVSFCGLCLGLGYFLMSRVSTVWQLYLVFGVLMSVGIAGAYVPLTSLITRWFVRKRGMMTGVVGAGIGAGAITLPPVAAWLITVYGAQDSFAILGIVILVVVFAAAQLLKGSPREIGLEPYGAAEDNPEKPPTEGLPLDHALRTGQLWILFGVYFLFTIAVQAVMVHIVPHVTDLGIDPVIAASMVTAIGATSLASRIGMGGASDRIGGKLTFVICTGAMLIALLWLLVARQTWMLFLFALVFGFAYGGDAPLFSPMIARLFGLRSHGAIFGAVVLGGNLGGALGPALAGYIFDVRGSYQLAFIIGAVMVAIALVLIALLKPVAGTGKLTLREDAPVSLH